MAELLALCEGWRGWAGDTGLSEQVEEAAAWRSREEVELAYRRWLPPWCEKVGVRGEVRSEADEFEFGL